VLLAVIAVMVLKKRKIIRTPVRQLREFLCGVRQCLWRTPIGSKRNTFFLARAERIFIIVAVLFFRAQPF
jgi:hypothetical protein